MENRQLKYLECFCVKRADASLNAVATVTSKLTASANLRAKVSGSATITVPLSRVKTLSATLGPTGSLSAKVSADLSLSSASFEAEGDIHKSDLTADYSVSQRLHCEGDLKPTVLEKLVGNFGDYKCVQKLFPIQDVPTSLTMGKFVGPNKESGSLYSFIDEGVFVGDYDTSNSDSSVCY